MQPTKCRIRTGKLSGRSGTPPSNKGPVRSRDLGDKRQRGLSLWVFSYPPYPATRPKKGSTWAKAKRPF